MLRSVLYSIDVCSVFLIITVRTVFIYLTIYIDFIVVGIGCYIPMLWDFLLVSPCINISFISFGIRLDCFAVMLSFSSVLSSFLRQKLFCSIIMLFILVIK